MLDRFLAWLRGTRQNDGHPDVLDFASKADKALSTCGCGHAWSFHEHLRKGTDCGWTGCVCLLFRPKRHDRPAPM